MNDDFTGTHLKQMTTGDDASLEFPGVDETRGPLPFLARLVRDCHA